jgi:uncharacterized NAD-dependent epimerase/dehydratase family protein
MIHAPFLLYIGSATDEIAIKTSRGLAVFRPDDCIGELRSDDSPLTLGLPAMSCLEALHAGARTLVLGVANAGGTIGDALIDAAEEALTLGLDVAAGLHQRLRDIPRLVAAAEKHGCSLHDIRVPKDDIPIGNGKRRAGNRLLTVGTDCSVGKMYTSLALWKALASRGLRAAFRATGQTGILVAGSGVPLDAVVADFIAGAVEQLSPDRYDGGWDVIEGQGSLFHPSFAGVSTGLLHGAQPDFLVMCHEPYRSHMRGLPHYQLPDLQKCLDANLDVARLTNPKVQMAGIALNTSRLSHDDALRLCSETEAAYGLPCSDPYSMGVEKIIDRVENAQKSLNYA